MEVSTSFEIDYAAKIVSVKRHFTNIHPLFSVYMVLFTALALTHFYRRPTIVPSQNCFYIF